MEDFENYNDIIARFGHQGLPARENCKNCDENIGPFEYGDGFCSQHCYNQYYGEVCEGVCAYCNDNELSD